MEKKHLICFLIWLCCFVCVVVLLVTKKNDTIVRLKVNDVTKRDVRVEVNGRVYTDIVNPQKNQNSLYVPVQLDELVRADIVKLSVDKGTISSYKFMSSLGICKFDIFSLDIEPASSVDIPISKISNAIAFLNTVLLLAALIVASLTVSAICLISRICANERTGVFVGRIIEVFACNRASMFAIPWMVSMITTYYLCMGISLSKQHNFGYRCCMLAILLTIGWTIAFALNQYKQYQLAKYQDTSIYIIVSTPIRCRLIIVLTIAFFLGAFLAHAAWNSSYCSLIPYERIDNGTQHIDTLYHSSIAESWRWSLCPSTLLNDERYLAYHTFSNLLIGIIAGIMRMPAFVAYNYLYPVLFLPVYCFSILLAVSSAKSYFEDNSDIHFIDLIIVGLFVFGFTHSFALYGDWKRSFITSESFLVANTLSFLVYAMTFYALKNWKHCKARMVIYCVVVMPVAIFVISWSKISVGFIFSAGMIYYIFRTHCKDFKFWALNILYALTFFVSLNLFSSHGNVAGTITSQFEPFAFNKYIGGGLGMCGHYIVLSLMALLFLGLDMSRNRFTWNDFKSGRTVWIEGIVIVTILAFLPASILDIRGASAFYFSAAPEIPSLILLCGHNYINLEEDARCPLKQLIYIFCFCWCVWMGYHHMPDNPLMSITNKHNSSLSLMLLEIRNRVANHHRNYTIYLDKDSFLSKVFKKPKTAIFVCPALIGVGVINATFECNGSRFYYTRSEIDNDPGYGLTVATNSYLSYEDAIILAKQRGKRYLIHLSDSDYQIVPIY